MDRYGQLWPYPSHAWTKALEVWFRTGLSLSVCCSSFCTSWTWQQAICWMAIFQFRLEPNCTVDSKLKPAVNTPETGSFGSVDCSLETSRSASYPDSKADSEQFSHMDFEDTLVSKQASAAVLHSSRHKLHLPHNWPDDIYRTWLCCTKEPLQGAAALCELLKNKAHAAQKNHHQYLHFQLRRFAQLSGCRLSSGRLGNSMRCFAHSASLQLHALGHFPVCCNLRAFSNVKACQDCKVKEIKEIKRNKSRIQGACSASAYPPRSCQLPQSTPPNWATLYACHASKCSKQPTKMNQNSKHQNIKTEIKTSKTHLQTDFIPFLKTFDIAGRPILGAQSMSLGRLSNLPCQRIQATQGLAHLASRDHVCRCLPVPTKKMFKQQDVENLLKYILERSVNIIS